jgi:D-3-phosphoglycerate dehydrogenase / 2-oxoglutarate reductase
MRILVVGDTYFPAAAYAPAFDRLAADHSVQFVDIPDDSAWTPTSPSEIRLRETFGSPSALIGMLDRHDVLVVQGAPVSDAVVESSPELKLICCARGGPVNVDLDAATARGIPVVITPGKNADAVADLTIAFMVMLARRLPEVVRHVEAGGAFGHDNYEGRQWFGHDLAGKTLGLIGFGQVGRRVAARSLAFGMAVVAHDPFVAAGVVEEVGARAVDLETLLDIADFVSLHARAGSDNRHLIGPSAIARMKVGSYLINTARDTLVDEAALADGLASGRLAGIALDLVSPSPATGLHPLLAFPNAIITTHIGGATHETLQHASEMVVAEIERLAAGESLANVANRGELDAGPGGGSAA